MKVEPEFYERAIDNLSDASVMVAGIGVIATASFFAFDCLMLRPGDLSPAITNWAEGVAMVPIAVGALGGVACAAMRHIKAKGTRKLRELQAVSTQAVSFMVDNFLYSSSEGLGRKPSGV